MGEAVIVTGPQGCGKTLRAAELAHRLGCGSVVDEWWPDDPIVPGALHLTHVPIVGHQDGVRVLQFAELIGTEGAPPVPQPDEVRDAA